MKLIITCVATLLATMAVSARAATIDIDKYSASIATLRAKIDSGGTPGPNDPVVVAAVVQINAVITAIDTPALPVTSVDTFQSICVPATTIFGVFGDSRVAVAAAAAPNEAARSRIKAADLDGIFGSNLSALFPMLALSIKCDLAHMAIITRLVDSTPGDRRNDTNFVEGTRKVRTGLFLQLQGAIGVVAMPSIGMERRAMLLDMLTHYAPIIGQTANASEKQTLITMLRKARPGWPSAFQRNADVLLAELRTGKCSLICST